MGRGGAGQLLPPFAVIAHNFAQDSENQIHSDSTARRYGFRGGLVPGVADYAYMTRPVVESLGSEWLRRGFAEARFLKPVYDGDRVEARGRVLSAEPLQLEVELFDSAGEKCATLAAGLDETSEPTAIEADDYRAGARLPAPEERPPASLEILAPATVLAALEIPALDETELEALAERYRDDLALYQGDGAVLHPAFLLDRANRILSANVRLGPWIHTASRVRHLEEPDWRRPMQLRGRVSESYERSGHEIVVLDLALFELENGELGKPYAHVLHTAIIRPRPRPGRHG